MQLNKSSKKTTKIADQTLPSAPETTPAAETKPKSRTLKSSTPKKSESSVSASPSHHHKVSLSPVSESRPVETKSTVSEPARPASHEDIANLAYSLWAARGYSGGSPDADWLAAERQLTQKR
jgi:Protein of unknown function (DUF2934)